MPVIIVSAVLLLASGPGFAAQPNSHPTTAPTTRPGLFVVEPGSPEGFRYIIRSRLDAFATLGCGDGWPSTQGLTAEEDHILQYRLADGRHALGVYDVEVASSLILIYAVPKDWKPNRPLPDMSTEKGTLQAWLYRHRPRDNGELPSADWEAFLAASPQVRAQSTRAFALEGAIRVKFLRDGLLEEMSVGLHSTAPLPKFTEYLDHEEAVDREFLQFARERSDDDAALRWLWHLQDIATMRNGPPLAENVRVEGVIYGFWFNTRKFNLMRFMFPP